MSVLLMVGASTVKALMTQMQGFFTEAYLVKVDEAHLVGKMVVDGGWSVVKAVLPVLITGVLVGFGVSYAQVGTLFSFESIQPKFDKLDPIKGFKNKFFSAKAYIELGKSLMKVLVIGLVLWSYLKNEIPRLGTMLSQPITETWMTTGKLLAGLTYRVGFILIAFSALDVFIQRWQHEKGLKMSKEDVKREYEDNEGKGEVKQMREEFKHQLLSGPLRKAVQQAKVVVVNPTHYAVALQYERGGKAAPSVAAKGVDAMAARIRELAKEFKVPIMRDIPLAHALYGIQEGSEIPAELYTAVAEILNVVYQKDRGNG